MFCKNCGKLIPDDAVLCPYCGTSLVANPPPQSNVPQDRKKKKKTGCLISIISVIALITIILVIAISGSDDGTTTTGDDGTGTTSSGDKIITEDDSTKTYSIGDTVTVHTNRGDYSLKFTRVRETSERNEFADENPQRVVILEYEYSNISFDSDVVVSYLYFRPYDKDGNALSQYPDTSVKYTTNISQGKTATASVAYGLNSSDNVITLDFYDITLQSPQKSECTFNLTW